MREIYRSSGVLIVLKGNNGILLQPSSFTAVSRPQMGYTPGVKHAKAPITKLAAHFQRSSSRCVLNNRFGGVAQIFEFAISPISKPIDRGKKKLVRIAQEGRERLSMHIRKSIAVAQRYRSETVSRPLIVALVKKLLQEPILLRMFRRNTSGKRVNATGVVRNWASMTSITLFLCRVVAPINLITW